MQQLNAGEAQGSSDNTFYMLAKPEGTLRAHYNQLERGK
jgi:hypothetical protein